MPFPRQLTCNSSVGAVAASSYTMSCNGFMQFQMPRNTIGLHLSAVSLFWTGHRAIDSAGEGQLYTFSTKLLRAKLLNSRVPEFSLPTLYVLINKALLQLCSCWDHTRAQISTRSRIIATPTRSHDCAQV